MFKVVAVVGVRVGGCACCSSITTWSPTHNYEDVHGSVLLARAGSGEVQL